MDTLRLVGGGGHEVDLYSWLKPELTKGVEALAGILGFGLGSADVRWFDGAGKGSKYRGSRQGRREIRIPIHVYAQSRTELLEIQSTLTRLFDARYGEARLYFGLDEEDEWFVNVVREGEIDWKRKVDSDDRTYFKAQLSITAGSPDWTRNRPESFSVMQDISTTTLLPELAALRLSSGAAFGDKTVTNIGDADAWPVWTIKGPWTSIRLVGAKGETIFIGQAANSAITLTIDTESATIVDQTGTNWYTALGPAPRFWKIEPGQSRVVVEVIGAGPDTTVYCQWWPRRQAVL